MYDIHVHVCTGESIHVQYMYVHYVHICVGVGVHVQCIVSYQNVHNIVQCTKRKYSTINLCTTTTTVILH